MNTSTLIENILLPDGQPGHIAIDGDRIASLGPGTNPEIPARTRIDGHGKLALPGLIEGHIHLDKTFIGDRWQAHRPCSSNFNVRERVAFEKKQLANAAPVETRAAALVEQVSTYGTSYMRCHVDIDPDVGLKNLDAILTVRDRYRHLVDIQIVAFPQSGIITAPGTRELLAEALQNGADLIGGLDPIGFDRDLNGHLDIVFNLADRHATGIDIHLHDADTLGLMELEEIARRSKSLGMQGKVVVSHAYALGEVSEASAKYGADILADAGVSIMTNAPGDRPFPPVRLLRDAGVTVFLGNDNIRDAWWPYGEGDMLERAMILGYRSGFLVDEELNSAFELISNASAPVFGIDNYGLDAGKPADIVLVDASNIAEAVVGRPDRRTVVKRGKVVVENGIIVSGMSA